MTHGDCIQTAKPLRVVPIDAHDVSGPKPAATHRIAASNLGEHVPAWFVPLSPARPLRGVFITRRKFRWERIEAVFHRSNQNRTQRVQPDLQSGNLAQIKTKNLQPIDEAISRVFAQSRNLAHVWSNADFQLVEESCGNEIRRSASVTCASGRGKLSDGVPILVQNVPDALDPSVPSVLRLSIFAGFNPAKRGPCARPLEHTNRRGRIHSSILA